MAHKGFLERSLSKLQERRKSNELRGKEWAKLADSLKAQLKEALDVNYDPNAAELLISKIPEYLQYDPERKDILSWARNRQHRLWWGRIREASNFSEPDKLKVIRRDIGNSKHPDKLKLLEFVDSQQIYLWKKSLGDAPSVREIRSLFKEVNGSTNIGKKKFLKYLTRLANEKGHKK